MFFEELTEVNDILEETKDQSILLPRNFFNVTAEDLEYPELPELPSEEKEKFDLYIKGLWERQKGEIDDKKDIQ